MREHDPAELPADRFVPVSDRTGRKLRCTVCGRTGYWHPTDSPSWPWQGFGLWQVACWMDHPWPCSCGLSFRQYGDLWRHIGGPRPTGWGRQDGIDHHLVATCDWPRDRAFFGAPGTTPAKALQAALPPN